MMGVAPKSAGHRGRRYGLAAWLVHCERIFTAGASLTLAPGNEEDPLCMAPWKGRSYCQGWTLGGGAGNPRKEDPLAPRVRRPNWQPQYQAGSSLHGAMDWKGQSWEEGLATTSIPSLLVAQSRMEFDRYFSHRKGY